MPRFTLYEDTEPLAIYAFYYAFHHNQNAIDEVVEILSDERKHLSLETRRRIYHTIMQAENQGKLVGYPDVWLELAEELKEVGGI